MKNIFVKVWAVIVNLFISYRRAVQQELENAQLREDLETQEILLNVQEVEIDDLRELVAELEDDIHSLEDAAETREWEIEGELEEAYESGRQDAEDECDCSGEDDAELDA